MWINTDRKRVVASFSPQASGLSGVSSFNSFSVSLDTLLVIQLQSWSAFIVKKDDD